MTVVTINKSSTKTEDVTHKIGNWYQEDGTKEMFILAQTGVGAVSLICVKSGNRYEDWVKVGNVSNISNNEMQQICNYDNFKLIESVKIKEG